MFGLFGRRRSDVNFEPSGGLWSGEMVVSAVMRETPSIVTLRLRHGSGQVPFRFAPGQFVDLGIEIGGEAMHRSYSIASSCLEHSFIDLTIKHEVGGAVSPKLVDDTKIGDVFSVRGPFGRFSIDGRERRPLLWVGAGVGITPLMSMIRSARDAGWPVRGRAVFSFRSSKDRLFIEELKALEKESNGAFRKTISLTKPPLFYSGKRGRISTRKLAKWVPRLSSREVFVCGPNGLMAELSERLPRRGVPAGRVHVEAFAPLEPDLSLGGEFEVKFAGMSGAVSSEPGESILDIAERAGLDVDYSCRTGTCGLCEARILSGEVELGENEVLDDEDLEAGRVLTCQAYPKANCEIELP